MRVSSLNGCNTCEKQNGWFHDQSSESYEDVWLLAWADTDDTISEVAHGISPDTMHPPSLHERRRPIQVYPSGQDDDIFLHVLMQATKRSSLWIYMVSPMQTTKHTCEQPTQIGRHQVGWCTLLELQVFLLEKIVQWCNSSNQYFSGGDLVVPDEWPNVVEEPLMFPSYLRGWGSWTLGLNSAACHIGCFDID